MWNYIGILAPLCVVVIGIINAKYLTPFSRVILFVTAVTFLNECVALYLKVFSPVHHNVLCYNIFMLVEGISLPLAGLLIVKNRLLKRIILFYNLVFMVLWIWEMVTADPYVFKTIPFFVSSFFILAEYLYILIQQAFNGERRILNDALFWIPLSMVVYFGGVIPYFSIMNFLDKNALKAAHSLFYINYGLIVLRYTCLFTGYIMLKPKKL